MPNPPDDRDTRDLVPDFADLDMALCCFCGGLVGVLLAVLLALTTLALLLGVFPCP